MVCKEQVKVLVINKTTCSIKRDSTMAMIKVQMIIACIKKIVCIEEGRLLIRPEIKYLWINNQIFKETLVRNK